MIRLHIIFFTIFLNAAAFCQEAKVPCLKKNGGVGLNGLDKFDCDLASSVVNNPTIKKEFSDKIHIKLADKLFVKTSQRLEEIALIDRYYDQIGLDLKNMSPEVGQKCKLEKIAQPTGCTINQENLKFLAAKFPKLDKNKFPNIKNPLLGGMIGLTLDARNTKLDDVNNCPADGAKGAFYLASQFSETQADDFIVALRKNNKSSIDFFYDSFPQFKMFKDAQALGPDGVEFIKHFEEVIKEGPKPGESKKALIEKYLRRPEAQTQLGKVMASKCEMFAQNIKDYLCKDISHLGMTEDFSNYFFDKSTDPDAEINRSIAKGFSCKMENGTKSEEEVFVNGETAESWDNNFTSDTRKASTQTEIDKVVVPFCRMYSCKDDSVKALASCKAGGPLSSTDFDIYCKKSECGLESLQYLSFLKSLEIEEGKIENTQLASYAPEMAEQVKSKKRNKSPQSPSLRKRRNSQIRKSK